VCAAEQHPFNLGEAFGPVAQAIVHSDGS
jgi:hypothetical protein